MTIAAGRLDHLSAQLRLVAAGTRPDLHVVVAMGDGQVLDVARREAASAGLARAGVAVPAGPELPLAAARNAGAAAALDAGAELLCFLDVDCLPDPQLLPRYRAAASDPGVRDTAPAVLSGPVCYLPPRDAVGGGYDLAGLARLARPHRARPAPEPGALQRAPDLRLFWSLSFAMTAADWRSTGGFHEGYLGYGGEDTDFGQLVAAAGGSLWWVGGAVAYHQHHPTATPPVQHVASIVRNANLFHSRWGWFPMDGWLTAFARLGLACWDDTTGRWALSVAGRPTAATAAVD